MHQLQQPILVSDTDSREYLDHPERAASAITTTNHHHHRHNFTPMAFESSDPEANSLTSLSEILDNLPAAVKSGLGPLNTIRRSVSIRGWASYFYEISSNTMGATASHHEGATTAAAAHRTTVVSRTTSTTAVEMQQHSNRGEKRAAAQTQSQRRLPEPPLYEEPEQNYGINRFCGLQGNYHPPDPLPQELHAPRADTRHIGQLLVNNALSEGRPTSLQGHPAAGRIDRKAYVQGVAWLVHGLPDDLDKHERTELIRAMPPSLLEEAHRTPASQQPGPPYAMSSSSSTSSSVYDYYFGGSMVSNVSSMGVSGVSEAGWTLAQRALRALLVQLLVPLHMLWAYAVLLLGRACQLEREYKVAEQVVKHSGELGYGVGRGGVRLSGVIYNHGGARVGHLVTNVVAYTADGLVKGISDGIREARGSNERRRCCGGGAGED